MAGFLGSPSRHDHQKPLRVIVGGNHRLREGAVGCVVGNRFKARVLFKAWAQGRRRTSTRGRWGGSGRKRLSGQAWVARP